MSNEHLITEHYRRFDTEHDGKAWRLKGIFASTRPNANGRTYPGRVLESAINKYVAEHVANGTAFGCLDHPNNAQVSLQDAAVLITSLEWIGDEVHGECTVLDTRQGQELQRILEAGGSVGMSTRGTGGMDSKGVVSSDYKLVGIDVVARASAHSARRVEAIYENEKLVKANGDGETLSASLRRIKRRKGKAQTNTNPRLRDKSDQQQGDSPAATTTHPSKRGFQGMKNEDMPLTKGDRYIGPQKKTSSSATGSPFKTRRKPKFLKPSGSKVQLEAELVESLLQSITDHHEDGPVFEAAMRLGERYLDECKSQPTSAVARAKPLLRPTKDLKREADEAAVWQLVNGGAHNQNREQR